jgi:microcystin-dependent protein
MPTNFNDFTQGTTLSETDQIVGFTNTNAGGERKWLLGNLRNSLITGAATTIDTENLAANKALVSDASGKVGASSVTSTEIGYLGGVTTNVQQSLVPAGAVMSFAMSAAPTGWLECNGQAVNRSGPSGYPALFAAIGTTYGVGDNSTTFNLPDLRGEFIRGWDNSRGVDTGRTFGSSQKGTITIVDPSNTSNNVAGIYAQSDYNTTTFAPIAGYDIINIANYAGVYRSSIVGMGAGALETNGFGQGATRPRNIAMFYCIKF